MKVSIINGPNLNALGEREPEIYGSLTLAEINEKIETYCQQHNIKVDFFQSNNEGEIIDYLYSLSDKSDFIIMNPGAYTHTSVAIYDAIKSVDIPVIEVHLSNIHNRSESFRKIYITTPACIGQISGFGYKSYLVAIDAVKCLAENV